MNDYKTILKQHKDKLIKALSHLEYSYNKIKDVRIDVEEFDSDLLETWESFAARFARVVDIYLTRYVRSFVLDNDPGFSGTLRDFVNQGEKLGIVDDADAWMKIRELRNIVAHEYTDDQTNQFLENLIHYCPQLLELHKKIDGSNESK